jgi:hypothetical protein
MKLRNYVFKTRSTQLFGEVKIISPSGEVKVVSPSGEVKVDIADVMVKLRTFWSSRSDNQWFGEVKVISPSGEVNLDFADVKVKLLKYVLKTRSTHSYT